MITVADAEDLYLPALCVWREMRGESPQARLACFWVIRNRTTDLRFRWPRRPALVVTQPFQFSSFNHGDPNAALIPKAGGTDWHAWLDICAMCDAPGGDPTGGANQYEALPDDAPKPGWVAQSSLLVTIGKTRFYRL